jgi:hypothetical protein
MYEQECEVISCKVCGHEWDAIHNDLGSYLCPKCPTPFRRNIDYSMKIAGMRLGYIKPSIKLRMLWSVQKYINKWVSEVEHAQ